MKNDDIIENNKLIAEFMEIEIFDNNFTYALLLASALDLSVNSCTHFKKNILHTVDLDDFEFNSSWDWLMPVVEEIESMGYIVTITQNICIIKASVMGDTTLITRQTGNYSTPDTKIYNTWLALIDFIKWYKENTE